MRSVSAVAAANARPVVARSAVAPQASSLAAAVVLVLSATTVVLATVDRRPGSDYQLHTLLLGSDLGVAALTVITAGGFRAAAGAWRRHACALAAFAVGLALVPALLVHPSDRGVAALLRWGGAVALALALGSARREGRRLVIGALAVVTLTHVVVAVAERVAGGPAGLGALGEPEAYEIGGRYASTGLTVHPYLLAAWCAVAGTLLLALVQRRASAGAVARVAGAAAFCGIGLSMSRAGLAAAGLGLGGLATSALRSRDRAWAANLVAAGAALGLGVLANVSGWLLRAEQQTDSVDALSSGRGALVRQAWELLRDDPVAGVGPGRYVLALVERPELVALSQQSPRPVHLTPLLLVVEGGLLVVPALILLAAAIGRACRRGGAAAVAVALSMLPFLALDHLAWSYPQGIVLTGLWLGALDVLARRPEEPDPPGAGPPAAPGAA